MGIINKTTDALKHALGLEQIKRQTAGLTKVARDILSVPQKTVASTEDFEEILARLQLSEADLQQRKVQFQRLVKIYLVFAVLLFLYMIYLLFKKAFFPFIGCFGILLIIFSLFFRYSFWLFQLRERRLGCTFREWLFDLVGKKP